jgi:hypothetical protein
MLRQAEFVCPRRSRLNRYVSSGVRIGVVIADDTTMVYSPVSKNIEAGSTSVEKPNAIILSGSAADRIAKAAGSDRSDEAHTAEVGSTALEPAKVQAMQADLKANPPKPFDITRKLNVFTSKVQYVEFTASNYRLTTRQVRLPQRLGESASYVRRFADDRLRLDLSVCDERLNGLGLADDTRELARLPVIAGGGQGLVAGTKHALALVACEQLDDMRLGDHVERSDVMV